MGRLGSALKRAFVPGPGVLDESVSYYGVTNDYPTGDDKLKQVANNAHVYVCNRLRATLLTSVPLKLYTLGSEGTKDVITKGAAYELLQKVNPYWTARRLFEMTELSLGYWGQAFWLLERDGEGPPSEIWWARPDRVKVLPDKQNYVRGFIYEPINASKPLFYKPSEVIWFRYPNPFNEFMGMSPIEAAALSALTTDAAARSNYRMFKNGIQLGGMILPKEGSNLSDTQAKQLEKSFDIRFKGEDKAHRWAVLRFDARFQPLALSPKDAEYLNMMKWGLEEIARVYGIPQELVGGQKTYENVNAAERVIWTNTIRPECTFLSDEITEQLLPMFPDAKNAVAEFDLTGVEVLHESEAAKWTREKEQIEKGVITINDWCKDKGLDPKLWGDDWWIPNTMTPISTSGPEMLKQQEELADKKAQQQKDLLDAQKEKQADASGSGSDSEPEQGDTGSKGAESVSSGHNRLAYGGPEHSRLWNQHLRRTEPHEDLFRQALTDLFRRQEQSVIDRLRQRGRTIDDAVNSPFDEAKWTKEFRTSGRHLIQQTTIKAGQAANKDLGLASSFNVQDPETLRFIENRAQRFAERVNDTTWKSLQTSLSEGIANGESLTKMEQRVHDVMGDRIRSDAETIARTEVIGAQNGGTLASWRQTGVVAGKTWMSALDSRTRGTHVEAHGQTVPIDADFKVDGGSGPHPGAIGIAGEDINCRCFMTAVLDIDAADTFDPADTSGSWADRWGRIEAAGTKKCPAGTFFDEVDESGGWKRAGLSEEDIQAALRDGEKQYRTLNPAHGHWTSSKDRLRNEKISQALDTRFSYDVSPKVLKYGDDYFVYSGHETIAASRISGAFDPVMEIIDIQDIKRVEKSLETAEALVKKVSKEVADELDYVSWNYSGSLDEVRSLGKRVNVSLSNLHETQLDELNYVLEDLVSIYNQGGILDRTTKIELRHVLDGRLKSSLAYATSSDERVTLNLATRGLWDGTETEQIYNRMQGWLVGNSTKDTIIHEVGHIRHYQTGNYFTIGRGEMTIEQQRIARRYLSRYAATNKQEFVAEAYNWYHKHGDLPPSVQSIYDEFGGPELKRVQPRKKK